jgi:hypothetical protein
MVKPWVAVGGVVTMTTGTENGIQQVTPLAIKWLQRPDINDPNG